MASSVVDGRAAPSALLVSMEIGNKRLIVSKKSAKADKMPALYIRVLLLRIRRVELSRRFELSRKLDF